MLEKREDLDKKLFSEFIEIYGNLFSIEELEMLFKKLKIEYCKSQEDIPVKDMVFYFSDTIVKDYIKEIKHKTIKKELKYLLMEYKLDIVLPVEKYIKWFFQNKFNLKTYWKLFWSKWKIEESYDVYEIEVEDIYSPVFKYNKEFMENFLCNQKYDSINNLIKEWVLEEEKKSFKNYIKKIKPEVTIIKIPQKQNKNNKY